MKAQSIRGVGAFAVLVATALAVMLSNSPRVRAQDNNNQGNNNQVSNDEQARIQIGFQVAPVPLNLAGKNRDLVGLGSYLVNAVNDCNACHNGGGPPDFEYLAGHNPYNGQPKVLDPSVYLAGGQDFGPAGPSPSPDIITRNLTPDKTGLPEGGNTFAQFMEIIRHGTDPDHLHPNCSATRTTNCIPASTGIDGNLLQIMPWPYYQGMTDHDLLAIYTYLSAIPCIPGPAKPSDLPPAMQYAFQELHHDCGH